MPTTFTIPGRLPGLNEYTLANRANRFGGSSLKKKAQACITPHIPVAVGEPTYPVVVGIEWYEKDKRRDVDNVAFGVKFILDALVTSGFLAGDSQRYVGGITHRVATDPDNPRIVVTVANGGGK